MATADNNIVNLNNLPKIEEVISGNLFIIQTELGTRIIDWDNLPVIKLDTEGNADFQGSLSATAISVKSLVVSNLSAESVTTQGLPGVDSADNFYNRFTISNGIVTSSTYVSGTPEYLDIVNTQIPSATAYVASQLKQVYEAYTTGTVTIGNTSTDISFSQCPSALQSGDFVVTDFVINSTDTNTALISTIPYATATTNDNGTLRATLYLRQSAPASIVFAIKVSKHY